MLLDALLGKIIMETAGIIKNQPSNSYTYWFQDAWQIFWG